MIALISRNTERAAGQLWEIRCAKEERIPVLGIYTSQDNRPYYLPEELIDVPVRDWSWAMIAGFLYRL